MADITKISVNNTSYDLKDNTKSVVSLNGSWRTGVNSAVFYAPTSTGDTGQILISGGSSGMPT